MRRRRIALLALVLFGLSAGFGLLAFYSPVKSLPALATCSLKMTASSCQYILAQSKVQIAAAQFPLWLYQSEAEVAMGFAAVTVLSLLRLPKWSWLDRPLTARFPRRFLVALTVVGAGSFILFSVVDATWNFLPLSKSFVHTVNALFLQPQTSAQIQGYGVIAFTSWGLTILCFSLLRGFKRAMQIFGLPAILLLTVLLLIFDSNEMVLGATSFAAWSRGSVYLLSNWSMLVVSSFLSAWAGVKGLHG